ncbi:hypothetical protein LPJ72_003463 [Coemansia sp. Benny D160-2]|nr:hypothetical protein LPJ72_003463 [Coemansia sp. Benny D160-2]
MDTRQGATKDKALPEAPREAAQKRRPSLGTEDEAGKMGGQSKARNSGQALKRRNMVQSWKHHYTSNSNSNSSSSSGDSEGSRGLASNEQAVVPEPGYSESSAGSEGEAGSSVSASPQGTSSEPTDLAAAAAAEMAAVRIQRAWRTHVVCAATAAWTACGVTVERLRALGFDEATQLMRRPAVVRGAAQLLHTLLAQASCDSSPLLPCAPEQQLSSSPAGGDQEEEEELAPCAAPGRTFVAAHLFAAHPGLLATGDAALDAMVEAAATTTTQVFEHFVAGLSNSHADSSNGATVRGHQAPDDRKNVNSWPARLYSFASSFHAFAVALDSWKRADSKKLLSAMERHYLELDRLWQSVQRRTLGQGDESWRVSIHEQRAALVDRVRTLGGQRAVEQLVRRQRHLRLTYPDPQPSRTPSLPHQPEEPTRSGGSGPGGTADSMTRTDSHHDDASPTDAVVAKAVADPAAAQVDRILGNFDLTASAALEDASLAHELVLDPTMRLQPIEQTTPEGSTIQHTVAQLFFDTIGREMLAGGDAEKIHEHIASLFAYIRRELRTITPPASDARRTVDRELDPKWIARLMDAGAYSEIAPRLAGAVRLIRSVCAPLRDAEVDAAAEKLASVDTSTLGGHTASADSNRCVAGLLEAVGDAISLVHRVRADALNHQLDTVVRPWLRAHAAEYERSKLDQHLSHAYNGDSQQIIEATTGWMRDVVNRDQHQDLSKRCTVVQDNPRSLTSKHVFWESLLDLCFEPVAVNASRVPLTLSMDTGRIGAIQNDIQVVLSAGALCMLARSIARTNTGVSLTDSRVMQLATDAHGLLADRSVTMSRVVALVLETVGQPPDSAASSTRRDDTAALGTLTERLVRKTLTKEDPIYASMERHLRSFLLQRLCDDDTPAQLARRLDASKQPVAAQLKKFGLDILSQSVCDLLVRLNRLGSFNWQVCSIWYAKVPGLAHVSSDNE